MKTTSCPYKSCFCVLLFLFLVCLSDGCSKDSSSTGPGGLRPQYIAGHWVGTAREYWSNGGTATYSLDANITQSADSILGGNWLWTAPSGERTRDYFKGTISTSGKITIIDTSSAPENWSGVGWALITFHASLSVGGDTISGAYAWSGQISGTGSFVLARR